MAKTMTLQQLLEVQKQEAANANKTATFKQPTAKTPSTPISLSQSVLNKAVPTIDDGATNRQVNSYNPVNNQITDSTGKVQPYVPFANAQKTQNTVNTPVTSTAPNSPIVRDATVIRESDIPSTVDTYTPPQVTDYESALRAALEAQRRQEELRMQQQINSINANRDVYRAQAEDAARQAYVQRQMSLRELPEVMSTTGMSGSGLAESSLINVDNSYMNARNSTINARDAALRGLDEQVTQVQLGGAANLTALEAAYQQNLLNTMFKQSDQDFNQTMALKNFDQSVAESAAEQAYRQQMFGYNQQQDAINNSLNWARYNQSVQEANSANKLALDKFNFQKQQSDAAVLDTWLKNAVKDGLMTEQQALSYASQYGLY